MTEDTIKRRLAAVVAADMAGYSRLMQLDEAGTVTRQKACLKDVVLPRISEFDGRLVKTTGDGMLIEFPSAVNAVLCSVSVQRDMAAREAEVDPDLRIQYRVGINIGEIILDGDDIFGDGVNVAARLEALAEPGGIRISETVFNNVKGKLDLGFADLGAQKVKNIAEPVPTYQVLLDPKDAGKVVAAEPQKRRQSLVPILWVAAVAILLTTGYLFYNRLSLPATTSAIRVLILPYKAETEDTAHFAEAVSENLWLTLARLKGLTIVPRSASLTFRGLDPTSEQVAEHGPVTHILDGVVSGQGNEISVSSRLRRIDTGKEIWQQQTKTPPPDLLATIARQKTGLISALKLPLNATERSILEQAFTDDPAAFLLYARAEHLFDTGRWDKFREAMDLFEKAAQIDPAFSAAKAGYAKVNYETWQRDWSVVRNTLEARVAAEKTADAMLAKDPSNPDALSVKVLIKIGQGQNEAALRMAQGAIFKNSSAPRLRYALGWAHLMNAEYDTARTEFQTYIDTALRLTRLETLGLVDVYIALDDSEQIFSLLAPLDNDPFSTFSAAWPYAYAFSRTGNLEAARNSMNVVFQGFPPANLTWQQKRYPAYSIPDIFDTYAEAMRAAGMPNWPFGLDQKLASDQLHETALRALFATGFQSVDGINELGGEHRMIVRPDGTVDFQSDFLSSYYRGKWRHAGDKICLTFPDIYKGTEHCELFFTDRETSTPENPRYIILNSFGIRRIGVKPLDE